VSGPGAGRERDAGRVTGVGGVFRRARDPDTLRAFYAHALGLPLEDRVGMLRWREADGSEALTIVGFFDEGTEYFGRPGQEAMFNFRVDDLDALLARLRAEGAEIDEEKGVVDEDGIGRFAWVTDPEGNRVELWEPAPQ
jgi:predicted enzyme related to lactoylglutathione lyase